MVFGSACCMAIGTPTWSGDTFTMQNMWEITTDYDALHRIAWASQGPEHRFPSGSCPILAKHIKTGQAKKENGRIRARHLHLSLTLTTISWPVPPQVLRLPPPAFSHRLLPASYHRLLRTPIPPGAGPMPPRPVKPNPNRGLCHQLLNPTNQ